MLILMNFRTEHIFMSRKVLFVWDLDWINELCIFEEKWVATPRKIETNCAFWHSRKVEIPERNVPADKISK